MISVLVIEEEPRLRRTIREALSDDGHRVRALGELAEARRVLARQRPEVVLLDLGPGDQTGPERVRQLRDTTDAALIALSDRGGDGERIRALDAGADDVVSKPFSVGELVARVRAIVRRVRRSQSEPVDDEIVEHGAIRIDIGRHEVKVDGRRVHLTPLEFQLFLILTRERGRYVTVKRLLEQLWPHEEHEPYHLRVHMSSLRHKVERDSSEPRWILTSVGVGYRVSDGT
jgi:two-component system KDP operon response regulator KdpE